MADPGRLDELRRKFDENPRRYFAPLANEYRKAGQPDLAIELCRTYLPQQPTHMSGYIVYGQALRDAGQTDESAAVFKQALTLDPENIIALRNLGDMSRDAGDTVGAMRWYGKVLEFDPRNEEIAAYLGSVARAGTRPVSTSAPERQPPSKVRPEPEHDEGAVRLEDIVSEPDVARPPFAEGASMDITPEASDSGETADGHTQHDVAQAGTDPLLDQTYDPFEVTEWPSALEASEQDETWQYESSQALQGPWHAALPPNEAVTDDTANDSGAARPLDLSRDIAEEAANEASPTNEKDEPAAAPAAPDQPRTSAPLPVREESPFVTETMAELYVQQGLHSEALAIYRQLSLKKEDPALRQRITDLEARQSAAPAGETVRAFFVRIGAVRPNERVELAADRASPLSALFGSAQPSADDLTAAHRLSGAFGDSRARASRSRDPRS